LGPDVEPVGDLADVGQSLRDLQRSLGDHHGGDRRKGELGRHRPEVDAIADDVRDVGPREQLGADRCLDAHRRIRLRVSAITSSIARSSSSWITRYAMGSARSMAGLTNGVAFTSPRAQPFFVDLWTVPYSIQCQKKGS